MSLGVRVMVVKMIKSNLKYYSVFWEDSFGVNILRVARWAELEIFK
jgi:hypothetical protein